VAALTEAMHEGGARYLCDLGVEDNGLGPLAAIALAQVSP
jgi:hypothetical protein